MHCVIRTLLLSSCHGEQIALKPVWGVLKFVKKEQCCLIKREEIGSTFWLIIQAPCMSPGLNLCKVIVVKRLLLSIQFR